MAEPENNSDLGLVLRAIQDLRTEVRKDLGIVFTRLDTHNALLARLDERTGGPPDSRRKAMVDAARKHGPTVGISAVVVALVEVVPQLLKLLHG